MGIKPTDIAFIHFNRTGDRIASIHKGLLNPLQIVVEEETRLVNAQVGSALFI